jgi:hypothetical protein
VTPEQKEENRHHLLNNSEDYMIDIHGNFADVSEEARWFDTEYHYIGRDSLTPEGYQEVEKEIRNLRAGRTKFRRFPSELESLGESILAKLED